MNITVRITADQDEVQNELSQLKSQVADLEQYIAAQGGRFHHQPVEELDEELRFGQDIDIPLPKTPASHNGEYRVGYKQGFEAGQVKAALDAQEDVRSLVQMEHRDVALELIEAKERVEELEERVRVERERGERLYAFFKERLQQAETAMSFAQETGDFTRVEDYWREENRALQSIGPPPED